MLDLSRPGPGLTVTIGPGRALSLPGEHTIDYPAPASMRPGATAMSKDIGCITTGILQGVGQDREAVEGAVLVAAFCESNDSSGPPGGVNRDGPEGIAEDVP